MKSNLYSITLANDMFGYERAPQTFVVEAFTFQEAVDKARKEFNDTYSHVVEWRVL